MLSSLLKVVRKLASFLTSRCLGTFCKPFDLMLLRLIKYWHPYANDKFFLNDAICVFDVIVSTREYDFIKLTGTGVLQIYYKKYVYLIACGELAYSALELNYKNWGDLQNSEYKHLVDYGLAAKQDKGFSYYRIDRLDRISDEIKAKNYILSNLLCEEKGRPLENIDVKSSREKINKYCNVDILPLLEENYLSRDEVFIGPIHGDLTKNNILKNSAGQYVMIDLDRFKMKGPQFIDQLHFSIEQISEREKITWLKIIADPTYTYMESIKPSGKNLLGVYFLYRVNAEIKDNVIPLPAYINYLKQYLKVQHLM